MASSVQDLDRELTERDLAFISLHVVGWQDKARDLGLSEGEIDNIENDYCGTQEKKRAMLRRWKERNADRATFRELRRIAEQCRWGNDFLRHLPTGSHGNQDHPDTRDQDHPDADHLDADHLDADHPDADHPDADHPDADDPDADDPDVGNQDHPDISSNTGVIIGVVVVVVIIVVAINIETIKTILYRPFSSNFPKSRGNFVGRDKDVKELLDMIDFHSESYDLVCVVGSPGIGKSTLAIHVGNEMIRKRAVVHYIDMAEVSEGQLQRIVEQKLSNHINTGMYFAIILKLDPILNYFSEYHWNNLLVLDNCDECIYNQRQSLQNDVKFILKKFNNVKIMTTSREKIVYMQHYHVHELQPLSIDSACKLLDLPIDLPIYLTETEKKTIANLTGEIPLALQIIRSLILARIFHLTPTKIIDELRKNPISFLSPHQYSSTTLNFSISLSYNHLNNRTKSVGVFLAYFPGSFDQTAALSILKHVSTSSKKTDSIDELVARSLLELDKSTERYHFHRLIKEFFLQYSKPSEKSKFSIAFQKYFGAKLCNVTLQTPRRALISLNRERHNFNFLFGTIASPIDHTSLSFTTAVGCFISAVKTEYLNHLFSLKELVKPMKKASTILHRELLKMKNEKWEHVKILYSIYVELTINLASLLAKEKIDQAVQQYMNGFEIVETFHNVHDAKQIHFNFYSNLLYYEKALNETMIVFCQSKIMGIHGCSLNGSCNYYDIGRTLHFGGRFKESEYFFEKVRGDEYPIQAQVDSLLKMYNATHNTSKLEKINEQLMSMYVLLENQTSVFVFKNRDLYREFYRFLWSILELKKSVSIAERLIKAIYGHDIATNGSLRLDIMLDLAEQLCDDNQFDKAARVAFYIIDSVHLVKKHAIEQVQAYRIASISTFYSESHTRREANQLFVHTINLLVANNLTTIAEFSESCEYLIQLYNFDYLHKCYSSEMLKVMLAFGRELHALTRLILQLQFLHKDSKPPNQSHKPTMKEQSPSTSIIPCNSDHTALFPLTSIVPKSILNIPTDVIEMPPNDTIPIVFFVIYTQFVIARHNEFAIFIMNVIAVFIKICIFYILISMIWGPICYRLGCCCCFVPCCCCCYFYRRCFIVLLSKIAAVIMYYVLIVIFIFCVDT